MRRHAVLAALVMVATMADAQAQTADRDQLACEPDVHRLCDDVFPDVALVATCLVAKRQQLSIPCATALAHPSTDTPDQP